MITPHASGGAASQLSAPAHWAERVALTHLESKGWRLLASNYRLRGSELDLVMAAAGTVVVVEVKQRKSAAYGHPAESISGPKLARLRAAALHYVTYTLRRPEARVRLDAVLVLGTRERHTLTHIEGIG